MFPVTVELGESMAGAFNALTPVPMTDGGRRLCARDLLIRSSHFRIRRLSFSRASADSHDPFSVFKAMVDIMFWRLRVLAGASSQGPRFCGRIVSLWALVGLPLIDTLDSSPRVSTRALALGWRLFRRSSFHGVARVTPAGLPRALGGVFDSFEGYVAFSNGSALDLPFLQKSFAMEEGL